ncbi:MAG: hypothetical protein RL033_1518 [Pseudomonadota bacterium]
MLLSAWGLLGCDNPPRHEPATPAAPTPSQATTPETPTLELDLWASSQTSFAGALSEEQRLQNPVVVFVPGIAGSSLVIGKGENGQTIWPKYHPSVEELLSPRAESQDIVRRMWVLFDVYDSLLQFLSLRFETVPCFYDWRRSLPQASRTVGACVARAVKTARSRVPARKVAIVAHSMGGLAARYYLESGDTPPPELSQLITIGTPHQGSPEALRKAVGQEGFHWLNLVDKSVLGRLAAHPDFPSLYTLLPTPDVEGEGSGWLIGPDGSALVGGILGSSDQHERVVDGLRMGRENAAAARQFWRGISLVRQSGVKGLSIFGTGQKTTMQVQVTDRFEVVPQRTLGGDGTVPAWSSMGPARWDHMEVAAEHVKMVRAPEVLTRLEKELSKFPPPEDLRTIPLLLLIADRTLVRPGAFLEVAVQTYGKATASRGRFAWLPVNKDWADYPPKVAKALSQKSLQQRGATPLEVSFGVQAPVEVGVHFLFVQSDDGRNSDGVFVVVDPAAE